MPRLKITGLDEVQDSLKRLEQAVNAENMEVVGRFALNLILQRTERGEFLNPGNHKYSTRGWLYKISSGALKKEYLQRLTAIPKSQSKAQYVFLERGYAQFREVHGRQSAFIDLQYTGKMLNAMNDIEAREKSVSIGFSNARMERIAYYLSEAGAGKNKVIHKFFGLDDQETELTFDQWEKLTMERLKELDVL